MEEACFSKSVRNNWKRLDIMTLVEFYNLLDCHDWYYVYNDDHRVWMDGKKIDDKIVKIAETSADHNALYRSFLKYKFSGPPWGSGQIPKPSKPLV